MSMKRALTASERVALHAFLTCVAASKRCAENVPRPRAQWSTPDVRFAVLGVTVTCRSYRYEDRAAASGASNSDILA